MENVILGFLMIRSVTQYDLLQALQRKISPFYKASLGSIQHGLKILLNKEFITLEASPNDSRNKAYYHITLTGKLYFLQWMQEELDTNKIDMQISIKLFFMGHLAQVEKIKVICAIIQCLEKITTIYKEEQLKYVDMQYPENIQNIVHYQLQTLDLGYYHYSTTLLWFRELLSQEDTK